VKAIEMKIVYMIIALIVLIWALLFFRGLRAAMLGILDKVFG